MNSIVGLRLDVDDRPVTVPAGASILDAAVAARADVPTLCHDDRLSPSGLCRLCLVRVDAKTGTDVVAACVTPAADGMRVDTRDPAIAEEVRLLLALTAERLPERALHNGSEFAALCRSADVVAARTGEARGLARDDSHPYLAYDPDLCIACGRCVRMCDEVQGTFALTLTGRGADTVMAPGSGQWAESACVGCGGCADTCPTGAITERTPTPSKPSPAGRPDMIDAVTQTTCGYCGVGCSLDVHTNDGRIVSVTPTRNGAVNRGHACVKGRFAHGFVRSPDRLTEPLVRRDGRLVPATWSEALAYVAEQLHRIKSADGPDAIAAISSARATNEENYLMQKFMRTVVGTNNVDNCSRICHAPSATGLSASFGLAGGTNPMEDIDSADTIMLAGSNATEAHPVVGARIRQAVLAGAHLIVIDPRRTELAQLADVHLQCGPGSNVAVFHGLARLLIDHDWADLDFVASRVDGLEPLREVLADYPASRVEGLSGVTPASLRRAADLYGAARSPAIVYGLGVTEHAHGTDGVRALANLAILRGAVGTAAGGGVVPLRGQNNVQGASDMGALPDLLPGYQKVTDEKVRAKFERAWDTRLPGRIGLRIPEMFDAAIAGRVRALYVMGEDIAQTDPDSDHVRAALSACDLVVCQEIFLSQTARLADVVLPAASFLEKDGTFVNFDRRFQRVRRALEPPGTARPDFDILHALSAALGVPLGPSTPAGVLAECAALAPLFGGISHERLDRDHHGVHWPCRSTDGAGEPRLYVERFATPNGRAQLAAPQWRPPGEEPDDEYPFALITGRRLEHYNAGTMTRRTPNLDLVPAEHLDMHPDDAERLGVADGDHVDVTSRRATVRVRVRRTTEVAPGQLFLSFHFPTVAANRLTSDNTDEATSCPEYKLTAVRVRRVEASH